MDEEVFLKELVQTQQEYVVQCDNQSTIHLNKIQVFTRSQSI